jgi:2-polyprenyl-3-methyl-5-hydroxy-6-metoxy-1,4-benzoquinol methylase
MPVSPDHLTPADLESLAHEYYLSGEIADLDIEELAQRRSIRQLVAALGDSQRVLEMGFGTGVITASLLDAGVDLEVVEGAPSLCATARERHPGLRVHESMFEAFTPEQPYDAVLALHVVEHVDDPVPLLRHLAGWLRPDGRLIVVVPNAESLHRQLAVRMGLQPTLDTLSARDHLVGHRRVYGLAGLRADLAAAGLGVTAEFGYFLKTVPNGMMLDWPVELLEALNAISDDLPARLLANIGVVARLAG